MKKFLLLTILSSLGVLAFAQSPNLINYQAVARDLSGNPLVSTPVNVIYEIRQSTPTGSVVYSETHSLNTNQFGLFTAQIGGGTPVSGTFASINWSSGLYYLQVTVNGDVMPATQLLSVPYALHANTATSGTPGADGNDNLATVTTEAPGPNCAAGGNFIEFGVDDNNNGTLEAGEIDGSYYVCNGTAGTSNDTSATNEIQTISISNDTVFLSNGGFVKLPPALGDNWGSQVVVTSGTNVSGDGTSGNPLVVTDNDTSSTNELELPMVGNNIGDVIKWNGSAWVNATDSFIDGDNSPTNEIELPATANNNDVLTWNGSAWVALPPPSGADNWGSQVVITSGANMSGNGTAGNPLAVTDNDSDPNNERITQFSTNVTNDSLIIIESAVRHSTPLSNFNDGDWTQGTGVLYNTTDNVGIGTTSPGTELEISSANPTMRLYSTQTNSLASAYIRFGDSSGPGFTERGWLGMPGSGDYLEMGSPNALFFNTNFANRMVINNLGNVGIATTSPSTRLHVSNGHITMQDGNEQTGYIPVSDASGMMTWTDPSTIATSNDGDWVVSGSDMYSGVTGNVGIGTTAPIAKLDVVGNSAFTAHTAIQNYANNNTEPRLSLLKSRGATIGNNVIVQNNDVTGRIFGWGADGSSFWPTGAIEFAVDGTPGANDMPGRIVFSTTADNAQTVTERMRITRDGLIGIGTTTPGGHFEVSTTIIERAAQFISSFTSNSDKYGLYALASGGGTGENRGVQGEATGASTNKGVVGRAFGGTNNWAGFFELGNVYVQEDLRLGVTTAGGQNPKLYINTPAAGSNNTSIEILNAYNGASTTYGIYNRLTPGGTGGVHGIWNYITPSASSNSTVYGTRNLILNNGNGTRYGVLSSVNANGTGEAYGTFNVLNHDGSGAVYGFRLDATGSTTTGNLYGLYITGPLSMENYIAGNTGVGVINPVNRLDVEGAAVIGGIYSGSVTAPANGLLVAGNVGIGNTNPVQMLHIGSTTNDGMRIGSAEDLIDGGGNLLTSSSSFAPTTDNIRDLGTATLRWDDVYATNGTINTSDRRDKTNIQPLKYGIEDLLKLNPVSYQWKNNPENGVKLGLIAQDLQEIVPEVVKDWDYEYSEETGERKKIKNERLGVYYSDLIPVLIKSIQQQQKMIDELKEEIQDLKNQ